MAAHNGAATPRLCCRRVRMVPTVRPRRPDLVPTNSFGTPKAPWLHPNRKIHREKCVATYSSDKHVACHYAKQYRIRIYVEYLERNKLGDNGLSTA